jgi:glycosyltransferase involved in cell wall biosynthesis
MMEEKRYPKILIIGQSFNKSSGGGITISNLFHGWPKDRLAVASNVNLLNDLDTSVCEQYYQLGYNGKLHPFPLNLFLPKIKCGSLNLNKGSSTIQDQFVSSAPGKFKKIYRFLAPLLKFLGIYNILYKLKLTQDFKDWVNTYNPDIIYSQLSTIELIRFVSDIHDEFNKPIALHIMDDWPILLNNASQLFNFQRHILDNEFLELMDKSSILMSICQAMSDEYLIRYKKQFVPFHNPIVIEKWLPFSKNQWEVNDVFKILYTGRIGQANGKAILFMAKIIDAMNSEGIKIKLDIYTPEYKTKYAASINNLRGVQIKDTVEHIKMPALLASYDLLFLPLDFDKVGIRFAQYSMPTKASEYMISGTPILVYADNRTALAKYAIRDKWAYVVTQDDNVVLTDAIKELYSNYTLRKELAQQAIKIAIENEDAETTREKFRKCFVLKQPALDGEIIYPKVLIIGQTFNKNDGGGITISNLFNGWPKERVAVASNVHITYDLDISVCNQYYQLGYNGKLHPFPINIFLPKIKCGSFDFSNVHDFRHVASGNIKVSKYKNTYKVLSKFLRFLGIYNILYKLEITPDFKEWVTAFSPDIIYSQLSTLELIRFVTEVQEEFHKPVALHIMDDWPNVLNESDLLFYNYRKVVDREFRHLLNRSSIFMSICESMSEEYKKRYCKEFIPFHNPIDISKWLPYSKKDWTVKEKYTILYAGRIGRGIKKSIFDIANAVSVYSKTNNKIVFEILTNNYADIEKLLESNENVKWLKPIEYSELPKKFSSVDVLILPEDFDEASIEFLKYSIQTKVPEYMISGTPILVYADKRTALARYASRDGWAYIVSENDEMLLAKAFEELYSNISLRMELSEKARLAAIQNEDALIVRDNFRKNLLMN